MNFVAPVCRLIFFSALFFSAGCSTQINIKSMPEKAKVELISNVDRSAQAFGETPLILSKENIFEKQSIGPYILRISKDGFSSREVVITSLSGLRLDMNVELKPTQISVKTN